MGLPHAPINTVGNRIAIAPDATPTMAANRSVSLRRPRSA